MGRVIIVQGAQYGSEGKGQVASDLALSQGAAICVRTGGINAGHTAYGDLGKAVMQQLPTGWLNHAPIIAVGPGALVHPGVLQDEIRNVRERGYTGRILLDERCALHGTHHTTRSREAGRTALIGSTGKGCSEALVERIAGRGRPQQSMQDYHKSHFGDAELCDVERVLNDIYDRGGTILVEGTQGTLLDMSLGPYPFTTHRQTGPSQWLADLGLSPSVRTEVALVARACPIRVAGVSGPLPNEITWPELIRTLRQRYEIIWGHEPDHLPSVQAVGEWERAATLAIRNGANPREVWTDHMPADDVLTSFVEKTTVTQRVRRIAQWDYGDWNTAVRQSRPSMVSFTFMDYLFPPIYESDGPLVSMATTVESTTWRRLVLRWVAQRMHLWEGPAPSRVELAFGPYEFHRVTLQGHSSGGGTIYLRWSSGTEDEDDEVYTERLHGSHRFLPEQAFHMPPSTVTNTGSDIQTVGPRWVPLK